MKVEINSQFMEENTEFKVGKSLVAVTPPLDEDYWLFRVRLSDKQAIVGFPKFFTIGIGFRVEEDWNTNLPYSCGAEEIYNHIKHNKGDDSISDEACIDAIKAIQKQATRLQKAKKGNNS
jgi:hypothetical protein